MTRAILFLVITAVLAACVIWLIPLGIVLSARGYSAQEIITMTSVTQPQPDVLCTPRQQDAPAQKAAAPDYGFGTPGNFKDVHGDELPTSEQPERKAAPAEQPPAREIIATATINVRAGQGTNTAKVGQIKPREVVTVLEDPDGDWLKVKGKSVTGWVYRPLFDKR